MAGNGSGNMNSFIDGLFDEEEAYTPAQQRGVNPAQVGGGAAKARMPQMPVRAVVAAHQPGTPQMPAQGLAALGGGHLGPARPSTMPTFAPGVMPTGMVVQAGATGQRPQQPNGPGLIPAHVMPPSVSATGFAGTTMPRSVSGGLSSLQAKTTAPLGTQAAPVVRAPTVVATPTIVASPTVKLPVGGQVTGLSPSAAQPVSTKAATAAMSKGVASTATPAHKKQMTSESGASRARNADGSLKDENGGDEEDEELITRDVEEMAAEPIHYGKSTLTEEDMRRERMKDEERKLVNTRVVKVRLDSICKQEGVRANPKVAEAIALALHQRLANVMDTMVEFSRRRMDVEGDTGASNIVRTSNPRLYMKEQEMKRNEEREKRIAEKMAAESGVSALDPSALRRQEEEMNATVLDFAGPARRPRANIAAKIDTPGAFSSSHTQTSADSAGQSYSSIKDRNRRITLSDALKFMRQDLHSKYSQLTLNTMAGLKIPDSYTILPHQLSGVTTGSSGGITTRSSAASASVLPSSHTVTVGGSMGANQPARYSQLPTKASVAASTARSSASPTVPTPATVVAVQKPLNSLTSANTRSQTKGPSPAPTAKR